MCDFSLFVQVVCPETVMVGKSIGCMYSQLQSATVPTLKGQCVVSLHSKLFSAFMINFTKCCLDCLQINKNIKTIKNAKRCRDGMPKSM